MDIRRFIGFNPVPLVLVFIVVFLFFLLKPKLETIPPIPPGYELLCSPEGKYTFTSPPYDLMVTEVWDSEKEIREFIIFFEKERSKKFVHESSKYKWSKCDK